MKDVVYRLQPESTVSEIVSPRDQFESQIRQIWAETLRLSEDNVSIRDDFFRLGGDSIICLQLISRLRQRLNLSIDIKDILNDRTIEKLYDNLLNKKQTGSNSLNLSTEPYLFESPLVAGNNPYDWFELTEIQKAYLIGRLGNYEIGNVSNHVYSEHYYQTLDVNKLENVINLLIEKYPSLRTIYSFARLQQRFLSPEEIANYRIQVHDHTQYLCHDEIILAIRNRLSHKMYDPEQFPLFTFEVTQFKDCFVLHTSMDLLSLDGQSRAALLDLINQFYRDERAEIIVPNITFKDYQDYYQPLKDSDWYAKDKAYWENKIPNMPSRPELPFQISPDKVQYPKFSDSILTIEKEVWAKFKKNAAAHHVSYSSVLLSLYGSVIAYFSGFKEFLITMTLYHRYAFHEEINTILGDFTSTNLFHYVDFGSNLIESLKRTHDVMWNDINHALYTGLEVQRDLAKLNQLDSNKAVSPIVFTGMLGNTGNTLIQENDAYLENNELIEKRYLACQTSQAWIDLIAVEMDDKLISKWLYVEQLFTKDYIEMLNTLYCELIKFLAEENHWNQKMDLFHLPLQDYELLEHCNNDTQELRSETLFSQIENRVSNNIAVIDSGTGKEYCYQQLLEDCDLLSRYLSHSKNPLIAVLSEKGYNHVVSTLSIMKSGHAYLPLNIDWPVARLDEILEQGQVTTLLLSKAQYQQEPIRTGLSERYELLVIEDVLSEIQNNLELKSQLSKIDLPIVKSDDIAYVIFTSGSTGKPKGVTMHHQGALNTIDAITRRFRMNEKDKILALSELSFDLSVFDIFGILSVGGTVVFPDEKQKRDPHHWLSLIHQHQITIWDTAPQLAGLLVNTANGNDLKMNTLRVCMLSADRVPIDLPDKIKKHVPQSTIVCFGGATEVSIWSAWIEVEKIKEEWNNVPYGFAMPNQKIYILDHHHRHCPIGVIGEIYIGGVGVALNYWNDQRLTEKSFIQHDMLGRLYKTGDLARWYRDGSVEFIGRKDHQVKLNGYRVELEEISAKLAKLNGIEKAVVNIQKEGGRDYVIGYLLPKNKITTYPSSGAACHLVPQGDKGIEKSSVEIFKLAQHGILKNLTAQYQLILHLNEQQYRLRKSYRNFVDSDLDLDELREISDKAITGLDCFPPRYARGRNDERVVAAKINKNILTEVLSAISAIKLEDRVLPKYRYPSGGSCYSVRCFLNIAQDLDEIESGYYYYNPVEYTLSLIDPANKSLQRDVDGKVELHLVINWPAVKPLYGDLAKKLATIEVGHMLSLLCEALDKNNVDYAIEISEEHLDSDNTLIVKLKLETEPTALIKSNLTINYQRKEDLNLEKKSILEQVDDLLQLLEQSRFLVTLEGEASTENFVLSGRIFQKLGEKFIEKNIGTCTLGFTPYDGALYAMVLGRINPNEKNKADSQMEKPSLKNIINQKLAESLPDYMLPYDYVILDALPLSSNGKLEIKKLPKIIIQEQNNYMSPRNKLEQKMCQIWSEVLALSENQVGLQDDFFMLGGNSLLAMQLVGRLNNELEINVKLSDLYQLKTIAEIMDRFDIKNDDHLYSRIEGVI